MTVRTAILSRVRTELNDGGAAQVWSNALIYSWLNEALNQLSLDLLTPGYISQYLIPGQREYPLSGMGVSMALGLQSVEAPRGFKVFPGEVRERQDEAYQFQQQNTLAATDQAVREFDNCWALIEFATDQPYLVFRYAPVPVGGRADLLYGVWFYRAYANPPDDVTPLDVDQFNEVLLVWYICGRALSWLAEQRGKRGDPGAGLQKQNTANYYERLYQNGLKQRKQRQGAKTARMVENV